MSKIASPEKPSTVARLEQRHDDARQFAADQSKAKAWEPLPGRATAGFMELRGCTCRWPVNDPRHDGAVRYCGADCPAEASYCATHRQIAFAPAKRH